MENMFKMANSGQGQIKALGFVAVGTLFAAGGWVYVLFAVFAFFVSLDMLSGFAKAWKNGTWKSRKAHEGLYHKGGMLLVLAVSAGLDVLIAIGADVAPQIAYQHNFTILPIALTWYIVTEMGSILENCVEMQAPLPKFLITIVENFKTRAEAAGQTLAKETKSKNQDD